MLKLNKIDKKLLNSIKNKKVNINIINNKKKYVVIENRGGNTMYYEEIWEGKHFPYQIGIVFEGNEKECIKYIEEQEKETTTYEVFNSIYWDNEEEDYKDYYYIIKTNCTSGSYQSRGLDFRDIEAEFKSEEEAEVYIKLKTNIA